MADESTQAQGKGGKEQPIIVKKIIKGGHGHHGGAWKVAYADFVTAMMAFFIVMWILSASEETKEMISAYFDNPGAFNFVTGKMTIPIDLGMKPVPGKRVGEEIGDGVGETEESGFEVKLEKNQLDTLAQEIYQKHLERAISDSIAAQERLDQVIQELEEKFEKMAKENPKMQKLLESIEFKVYDDGLRIELMETEDNTFFEVGSAVLKKQTIEILSKLGEEIGKLPNFLEIEGHTDSRGFTAKNGYSNWELSSDRANAARRVLEKNGLWDGQNTSVTGFSDRILKNVDNPFDSKNRRVSILVRPLTTQELMQSLE